MSAVVEQVFETPAGKYLVDPYENWAAAEGVPIHRGEAVDLLTAETAPWARFGARGALCHLDGRCDFLTVFLLELAVREWSAWQHHLYEEVCLVVAGKGETEIDLGDGRIRTILWSTGALFAAPMNARYRHRATSDTPARLVGVNDLRYLLNLYRNDRFLFDNPLSFPERGEGEIVADLTYVPVQAGERPHELTRSVALASGSIGADIVELQPGTYSTARRQMFGSLLFGIAGEGETFTFVDPQDEPARHAWKAGTLYSPVGLSFHQHFNMGPGPARFLRIEFGSATYPILRPRKRAYGDMAVYASGNAEIDHALEPARVRADWLQAIGKVGVQSRM
jgi:mannose-6-phosphate isomerase-like protein (cupin superfamily)